MTCHVRSSLLAFGLVFACLLTGAQAQRRMQSTEQAPADTRLRGSDWLAYFPLEVGNEWVYSDGTSNFTVQVLGATLEANGIKYFEVSGYFPNDPVKVHKLRKGQLGQVLEYSPAGGDYLWYRFGNPRGSWRFETAENIPCVTGSWVSIGDVAAAADVPAGVFKRALRLDFQAPCIDAGVAGEYFAGGVGLVQRVLNTIAGPRIFRLIAAQVGSSTFPETSYGIEVSLDRPLYYNNLMPPIINPWPTARARLVVRNGTDLPVEFSFSTSQRFDFIVRDARGQEVLRWSDGRAFLQVMGQETLRNESRTYAADILLQDRKGKPLAAGFYSLVGYLTTLGSESGLLSMIATVTFEIRNLY
jgi:hypothetical protein